MAGGNIQRLGLVVRSGPWQGRSNRDQLDVALAAAALGMEIDLYFLGEGALQLLVNRDGAPAGLPAGHRAWASLPELTPTRVFVETGQFQRMEAAGLHTLVEAEPLDGAGMRERQGRCDRVLVL
jgi:sulfur relay (sulfurtransferase) DsrF/TusC family protein